MIGVGAGCAVAIIKREGINCPASNPWDRTVVIGTGGGKRAVLRGFFLHRLRQGAPMDATGVGEPQDTNPAHPYDKAAITFKHGMADPSSVTIEVSF